MISSTFVFILWLTVLFLASQVMSSDEHINWMIDRIVSESEGLYNEERDVLSTLEGIWYNENDAKLVIKKDGYGLNNSTFRMIKLYDKGDTIEFHEIHLNQILDTYFAPKVAIREQETSIIWTCMSTGKSTTWSRFSDVLPTLEGIWYNENDAKLVIKKDGTGLDGSTFRMIKLYDKGDTIEFHEIHLDQILDTYFAPKVAIREQETLIIWTCISTGKITTWLRFKDKYNENQFNDESYKELQIITKKEKKIEEETEIDQLKRQLAELKSTNMSLKQSGKFIRHLQRSNKEIESFYQQTLQEMESSHQQTLQANDFRYSAKMEEYKKITRLMFEEPLKMKEEEITQLKSDPYFDHEKLESLSLDALKHIQEITPAYSKKIETTIQTKEADEKLCPICMDEHNKKDHVMNPCGHCFCGKCSKDLTQCAICRKNIDGKIKVYN